VLAPARDDLALSRGTSPKSAILGSESGLSPWLITD